MVVRFEIERREMARLVRVDFVGVSGQTCGSRFEVHGPTVETFFDLGAARARLDQLAGLTSSAAA